MKNLKYNVKITDFRFDCRVETCARRARFHGICVEMTGCAKQFEIVVLLIKPDIEYSMCATLTSLFHFFCFCKIAHMNRFQHRHFTAVLIGCLVFTVCSSHYNSQAQNAEPTYPESHGVASVVIKGAFARIGARSSQREGEMSSLRWLSSLMEKYPRQSNYRVEWQNSKQSEKRTCVTSYDAKAATLTLLQIPMQTTKFRMYYQSWLPISRTEIMTVAKRNGALSDFN